MRLSSEQRAKLHALAFALAKQLVHHSVEVVDVELAASCGLDLIVDAFNGVRDEDGQGKNGIDFFVPAFNGLLV